MNRQLLALIQENSRLTDETLATMLNVSVEEVVRDRMELERSGVIRGYHAVIDWDLLNEEEVTAIVDMRVMPHKDTGFENLARIISEFPEVVSLALLSGSYDFTLTVKGRTFREVANFVATCLATLDGVQETATYMMLRRYKENGVLLIDQPKDERRGAF